MIPLHPPDSPIAHLMLRVARRVHHRTQTLLGELGLYRGQPVLLAVLWEHEGYTHSELAEHLGVTPATITKMAQRMEQAGFIERIADAGDQRISRVYLTEQGRAVRRQVDHAFATLEEEMVAGCTPEEREQLLGLLVRVFANLDAFAESEPELPEGEKAMHEQGANQPAAVAIPSSEVKPL